MVALEQGRLKRIIFNILYAILVLFSALYYTNLRWSFTGEYAPASLAALLSQEAAFPFQYRVLTLFLVKQITAFLNIASSLKVFYYLEFLFSAAVIFSFRYYLSLFIKNKMATAILSLFIIYILPFNYVYPKSFNISFPESQAQSLVKIFSFGYNVYYPYDTPSVMFFILGLILIKQENWKLYYPMFIIATLNRETTCFLTMLIVLTGWGIKSRKNIILHVIAQFVIWSAVKFALALKFSADNSRLFDRHIDTTMIILTDPESYLYLLSNFGFLLIPAIFIYKYIDDVFARRSILILIPFYLGMSLVATLTELRDFGELVPVVLTGIILALRNLLTQKGTT